MFSQHLTSSATSQSTSPARVHGTTPTSICLSLSLGAVFSSPHLWIVNSGATRHICSQVQAFTSLKAIHVTVTLPNHATIPVMYAGDVHLSPVLVLKDVLFVPQFQINLLSVSALLASSSLTIQFLHDGCVVQDLHTKKMIGRGDKVHGLYVLHKKNLQMHTVNSVSVASINNISAHIWHNRLGHLSFKKLDSIKDKLQCDVSRLHRVEPCYICPLAKQRRLSFYSHNNLSKFPFDIVHCDTWGPYHTASRSRQWFFLTLVDDCTCFTWVYLMKNKSDATYIVPCFIYMVLT
ncbi:hypothetical protein ACOSQ3_027483 [Xanthoceras sorbifolium]